MASYQLINTEGDNYPQKVVKEKTFIDLNYEVQEVERNDNENKHLVYKYKTIRVRGGVPEKNELIRFMIHTEYSIDDEIALINNDGENWDAYIVRRNELKAIAKELYNNYIND